MHYPQHCTRSASLQMCLLIQIQNIWSVTSSANPEWLRIKVWTPETSVRSGVWFTIIQILLELLMHWEKWCGIYFEIIFTQKLLENVIIIKKWTLNFELFLALFLVFHLNVKFWNFVACICHFYVISLFFKCVYSIYNVLAFSLDLFLVVLILQLIASVVLVWIKASAKYKYKYVVFQSLRTNIQYHKVLKT